MTNNSRAESLSVVRLTLNASNSSIGPKKAARNELILNGWSDEEIDSTIARYINDWPHLDWLRDATPFQRELVRTAAGDETETVRRALVDSAKRTSQQRSEWATKGNKSRVIYSAADKEKWRTLATSPELAHVKSKRDKAEKIAKRLGLPMSATETIRKAI